MSDGNIDKTNRSTSQADRYPVASSVDVGHVEDGHVVFDAWRSPADTPSPQPVSPLPPDERVGFAIVGVGRLALEEILPAFAQSTKAKAVALVSGTTEKMRTVARQYGIKESACYSYEDFDTIADNPDIKAVYIVLPNGMHREFTQRSARAGKHVLCEKPMSVSSPEAMRMIEACAAADVKLMIAYRIQYEAYNMRLAEMIRDGRYGRLVGITAVNVQTVAEDGEKQWRHKKALAGGGSLPDIGLYCLNTARFLTGEEPIEVAASLYSPPGDPRFADVEETVSFTLRFPSGTIANCLTSYGARDDKRQRLNFATAVADMPNAYLYNGQQLVITRRDGDATSEARLSLQAPNQFAAEIDHMAACIIEGKAPRTPGEEGLRDHVLMEAIYRSAATGASVKV